MKKKLALRAAQYGSRPDGGRYWSTRITAALPYFVGERREFVHVVRSGVLHAREGVITHASFDFFCGNTGIVGRGVRRNPARLTDTLIGERRPLCTACRVRCEGQSW